MFNKIVRGMKGFTLIELLAVMSIVAVLAAIVSVAVSGSGQTSRDAQVAEDSNSAGTAVADFRSAQPVTELFTTQTTTIATGAEIFTDEVETTSNQWPEALITDIYPEVFIATVVDTTTVDPAPTVTVNDILFLDDDGNGEVALDDAVDDLNLDITVDSTYTTWVITSGTTTITLDADTGDSTNPIFNAITISGTAHTFELNAGATVLSVLTSGRIGTGTLVGDVVIFQVDNLIAAFTAIDWDQLQQGGFSTSVPESFDQESLITTSISYTNYLWLLEIDTAPGGATGTVSSRNVAVYALIAVVEESGLTDKFNLTFRRLT